MILSAFDLTGVVYHAIEAVETNNAALPDNLLWLDGHTSPKQRLLLNELCQFHQCRYLEVGVFHGASLLSAAYRNFSGKFTGIDNFSALGKEKYEEQQKLWAEQLGTCNVIEDTIQTTDYKASGINVFFYDANFNDTAAGDALVKLAPDFAPNFILIADNWSRKEVRITLRDALAKLGYSTYSSFNLTSDADCDLKGWWSGWGVFVIQKKPLRYTTELRGIAENEVPIYALKDRQKQKLWTIDDYNTAKV